MSTSFDVRFAGGVVVDGTGSPRYSADVVISGGRIAGVGHYADATAREVVDISGKVITPGFIDMLHNYEMGPFTHPEAAMAVAQGVTTAVAGGCGLAAAPLDPASKRDVRSHLMFKSGWHEYPTPWDSFSEYLEAIDGRSAVNVASYFGFDNLWFAVRGFDASPPSTAELDRMAELATEALENGAIGMSHGAAAASLWSTHEQVVHVARAVGRAGGIYAPHHRMFESDDPFAAFREAISVGREAEVPVHFLHFKSVSPKTHDRIEELVELVDEALDEGIEVTLGSYPYGSGGGGLRVPAWAEEGGPAAARARLRDPETRKRIAEELDQFWGSLDLGETRVMNIQSPRFAHYLGRTLEEIAATEGITVGELCCRLMEDEESAVQHMHRHGGENFDAIVRHPAHVCVSDAIYAGVPHPRCFGAFPRYIETYVRERRVLSLEEFVRQSTSAPAARCGLSDRGAVKAGLAADLVVFDFEAVRDNATYDDPGGRADGYIHVMVNGQFVMRDGELLSGVSPGRALRRDRA